MTRQQANWAADHDWWLHTQLGCCDDDCTVKVRNDMGGDDLYFTDFDELYVGAGY